MRKRFLLLTALAVVPCLFMGVMKSLAAEGQVTVVGTVSITEDDDWNITAVKLTEEGGTVYNITLDAKGKALGTEMDGNKVSVTGTLAEKDGAKWLTVTSYKAVDED
jgi:hypothetical protein